MSWFDKLERKFGKYAIKNLMFYIIVLYVLGLIINIFAPQVYQYYLSLNAQAILHGQIWRIFTFIIQPPQNTSLLFMLFALYFYYMIGSVLERIWGSFKFNVYFFTGVILQVVAAIIIYLVFGYNFSMSTYFINLALFMAFAVEQPDMEVLLFFIIPIKIKWLAVIDAIVFGITMIGGFCVGILPYNVIFNLASMGISLSPVLATSALVSMINFIVFAILYKKGPAKTQTQKNFRKAYKTSQKAQKKREEYAKQQQKNDRNMLNSDNYKTRPDRFSKIGATKHRCAVCGRTERDDDSLVFRFCTKCEGNLEYCQDHLYTHIHVTSNNNGQNNDGNNIININK